MKYLKWKLSHGTWGTQPGYAIVAMGGRATVGWAVDDDGYRIGYLWENVDITHLDSAWDVSEVTEAQALAFCQQFYAAASVWSDGQICGPPAPL
tara:strand:- start:27 stop:308 length:282 start_codon:yes stop_codon:yes gene_type:complete